MSITTETVNFINAVFSDGSTINGYADISINASGVVSSTAYDLSIQLSGTGSTALVDLSSSSGGTYNAGSQPDSIFLTSQSGNDSSVPSGSLIGNVFLQFDAAGAYEGASIRDVNSAPIAFQTGGTITCFAAGTAILGFEGSLPVESIKVGDNLVTVRDGGPVTQTVIWTGKRTINLARHPEPHLARPIRILAGAISAGVPERDLRVSPEHAIYLNGALFPAYTLINGTTIYQETTGTQVTYYHIELASHDVILAEGLATESYLDTGNRDNFENVSGVTVLHPDFTPAADADFCAPLIREGEQLAAVRAAINTRAATIRRAA